MKRVDLSVMRQNKVDPADSAVSRQQGHAAQLCQMPKIIATASQMKQIDNTATEQYAIASILLMEHAALGVYRHIQQRYGVESRCVVLCGKGNNGGDGFAVARHLAHNGYAVQLLCPAGLDVLTDDAAANARSALRLGIPVCTGYGGAEAMLSACDVVVDALFGFGFHGAMSDADAQLVEMLNASECRVVSVDLPSGLHADDGVVAGPAVRADSTVTFSAYKRSAFLYPAADYYGELELCDIGIPHEVLACDAFSHLAVTWDMVEKMLPQRRRNTHKGSFGRVLAAAGSPGMTGAAYLAAQAAVHSGAGLVTLAVPAGVNAILEEKTVEAMTLPVTEDEGGCFSPEAAEELLCRAKAADAVLFGPGIGRRAGLVTLCRALLTGVEAPLILDADALYALSQDIDMLNRHRGPVILTPHTGEMARLLGLSASQVERDRIGCAERFAKAYHVCVILKGPFTVIALPDCVYINHETGNPGMATGGSGDVLAGVLAALLAGGMAPKHAAVCAVYLHALAGDLAAESTGLAGLTASAMLQALGPARKMFEKDNTAGRHDIK